MQQKGTRGAIKNEAANGLKNENFTVAMARTNDPNSATSQFFINVKDNEFLNYAGEARPGYAVFGRVVEGMDTVTRIKAVPTSNAGGHQNVPTTPVVIGDRIEWRSPEQWEADRSQVLKAFQRWRADWESLDTTRYLNNYSAHFRSKDRDFDAWSASKKRVNSGKKWVKINVNDMSLFAYPGAPDLMMITFEQDYRSNNLSRKTMKRQYWAREGSQWRIVHETVVNS
jgi:hypothetical protein